MVSIQVGLCFVSLSIPIRNPANVDIPIPIRNFNSFSIKNFITAILIILRKNDIKLLSYSHFQFKQ